MADETQETEKPVVLTYDPKRLAGIKPPTTQAEYEFAGLVELRAIRGTLAQLVSTMGQIGERLADIAEILEEQNETTAPVTKPATKAK